MSTRQDAPLGLSPGEADDSDGQWAAIKAGEPTITHEDVAPVALDVGYAGLSALAGS
jgi:hypothetical protein